MSLQKRQFEGSELLLTIYERYGGEMLTLLGSDGMPVYESPKVARVLGYQHREEMGDDPYCFVHPEDCPAVGDSIRRYLSGPGEHAPVEYRIRHADGSWRWFESRGVNLLGEARFGVIVVSTTDVTSRRETEVALERERNLLRTVIDSAQDVIFVKDTEHRFLINNATHLRALGLEEQRSAVGKTNADLWGEERSIAFHEDDTQVITTGEPIVGREELVRHSDGEERWYATTKVPLRGPDGTSEGVVGISRDITQRKRMEEELRHRAYHDPLTDLPNRLLLMDRLSRALDRAQRSGKGVSVLFLDLDNFKHVNDTSGHELGDRVLVEVAHRLRVTLRDSDILGRIGGDEFVAVLDEGDRSAALQVVDRLRSAVAAPITVAGGEVEISATVGMSVVAPSKPGASGNPEEQAAELIRRADRDMYRVKRLGQG